MKKIPAQPIPEDLKEKIIDYWLHNKNNEVCTMTLLFNLNPYQINKIIDKYLISKIRS